MTRSPASAQWRPVGTFYLFVRPVRLVGKESGSAHGYAASYAAIEIKTKKSSKKVKNVSQRIERADDRRIGSSRAAISSCHLLFEDVNHVSS